MQRCLQLAELGTGKVAPNPMVGAVLMHDDLIIAEGYHQKCGEAHAEVNCINQAIQNGHSGLLGQSTLYVSLEPCVHFGKTAPCADLIVKKKIPKVVIGCRDPFTEVNGKGIEKLKTAGVEVTTAVLEKECAALNKRFFTFHTQKRPYLILKWAETADGFMASAATPLPAGRVDAFKNFRHERLLISNEYSNRLVHKWRSEESAILIGTNTASQDDPELTTRLWPGNSPVRLLIDMDLKLPASLQLFNKKVRTIIFNAIRHEEDGNLFFYSLDKREELIPQLVNALYKINIQSVLIEGGARLLQSFINGETWDEMRIIKNQSLLAGKGLAAPLLPEVVLKEKVCLDTDVISFFINPKSKL